MDHDLDALLGFSPDYDSPIPYMARTRAYYAAIGYIPPYRWAHHLAAPFTPLAKPLGRGRGAILTAALAHHPATTNPTPSSRAAATSAASVLASGKASRNASSR